MQYPTSRPSPIDFERDIYSVSRLNGEVRAVLEGSFPLLWVEGEISNLALPSSGHAYFSLKDAHAQVRCALFRTRRTHLRFRPANGMQVLVRARVGLYEGRGEFQLIVEHMESAGEGALRQAFERLKQKLANEGLFAAESKRALPGFPRHLGVITSPTGAAIRDVLSVLRRRLPGLPIVLYPVPVQGDKAAKHIVQALHIANRRRECDVLLLVRGGGSLEDLMAFNDEAVARAVAASEIPVVAGVGHEIDFSIVDFVADRRAATPSAAAELASPDRRELLRRLVGLKRRMGLAQQHRTREQGSQLEKLRQRLAKLHPAGRLAQQQQRIDEMDLRLRRQIGHRLQGLDARLGTLRANLAGHTPAHRLEHWKLQLRERQRRLHRALRQYLSQGGERLARAGQTLNAVSPLATLLRGYAIVSEYPDGPIVRDAETVGPGAKVWTQLARGRLVCLVEEAHPKE